MSLALTQSATAIVGGLVAGFLATGGTAPFTYEVLPNGAGGSIDATTGEYTAPANASSDLTKAYDTIQVTDSLSATATAQILIGTPLLLFCEILWRQLGLSSDRVWLWDQKTFQPTDSGLYITVSEVEPRPFGNNIRPDGSGGGLLSQQYVAMKSTLDLDIISRDASARDRKAEVLMALVSQYSQSQQEINGFYIARLPAQGRFVNLSHIDGAAIPYRYKISINIQYAVSKVQSTDYFDSFASPQVTTNP